ncbi:MAG: hypothetical protein Q8N89_05620 [Azonexus sp.]|nr:hypothetical protein [Azonexus sp.]
MAGLSIGMLFGIFAQRSRFCLRSAVVEFSNRDGCSKLGRLAIRLFGGGHRHPAFHYPYGAPEASIVAWLGSQQRVSAA